MSKSDDGYIRYHWWWRFRCRRRGKSRLSLEFVDRWWKQNIPLCLLVHPERENVRFRRGLLEIVSPSNHVDRFWCTSDAATHRDTTVSIVFHWPWNTRHVWHRSRRPPSTTSRCRKRLAKDSLRNTNLIEKKFSFIRVGRTKQRYLSCRESSHRSIWRWLVIRVPMNDDERPPMELTLILHCQEWRKRPRTSIGEQRRAERGDGRLSTSSIVTPEERRKENLDDSLRRYVEREMKEKDL